MGKEKLQNLDMFSDNAIAKAKQATMQAARGKGCECPCCGQFVKVYNRKINSGMARQLIHAFQLHGVGNWFHTRDVVLDSSGAGDFSKLEWWGLIEPGGMDPQETERRTSGLWRVTGTGGLFVMGKLTLPANAVVYNNTVLEKTGPDIGIADALGQKFNYRELMKPVKGQAA